ncbi:MAG TPA: hypothetical protein VGV35_20855 [Bryobacteraceae bacterium]|nr:hypothetical protein [Bryobacteraceae bacterium]
MTVLSPTWGTTTDGYAWQYTFQGGRYDQATGTIRFGTRHGRDYSARTGIWEEQDDDYWSGADLYAAFGDSPIARLDPVGRDFYSDSGFQDQISRLTFEQLRQLVEEEEGWPHAYQSGAATVEVLRAALRLKANLANLTPEEIYGAARDAMDANAAANAAFDAVSSATARFSAC